MSLDRELKQHKDHMDSISHCPLVERVFQIREEQNAVLAQEIKCKKLLSEMRVCDERVELFKILLLDLVARKEITIEDMTNINEYIQSTLRKCLLIDIFKSAQLNFANEQQFQAISKFNNKTIWDEIYQVVVLGDQLEDRWTLSSFGDDEDKQEQYRALMSDLKKCNNKLNVLQEEMQKLELQLLSIVQAESISNASELKNLIKQLHNAHIELLVIDPNNMDTDIASVIQMRAKKSAEKGHELIIMTFNIFNQIMHEGYPIENIDKLSFLHHGDEEFGYVTEISNYISHMPDLKQVVLRGCGTANKPADNPEVKYDVKISKISYDKKPPIQGETNLMIQQKEHDGKTYTKLSWASMEPNTKKRVIHQIVDVTNIPPLNEKKITDDDLKALEKIAGVPLLNHSNQYVNAMRNIFFNKNIVVSKDEVASAKKAFRRARTEVATVLSDDLLAQVIHNMTLEQQQRVSVKAYVDGYYVRHDRVIPHDSHDQIKSPKAVRIGPEFHRTKKR